MAKEPLGLGCGGPWPGRGADGALARREESSNGWQRAEVIRLEQDVFTALAGRGKLYVYQTEGFWSQIKSAGYGRGLRLDPPQPPQPHQQPRSLSPSSAIYASRLYLNQYSKTHPERLAQNKPGGPIIRGTPLPFPPTQGPWELPRAGRGPTGCILPPSPSPDPSPCCRERLHPPHGLHRQHGSGECRGAPRGRGPPFLSSSPPSAPAAGPQRLHRGGGDGGSRRACARVHRAARGRAACK